MAVDTHITAQSAGSMIALDNVIQVYQRTVDFSKQNLASGAWFEAFTVPANSIVLTGWMEVLTVDAGGGTVNLGIGGTGTELISTLAVNVTSAAVISSTAVSVATADTLDLSAASAALTTAKVRITLVVCSFTRGASAAQHDAT